MTSTPTCTCGRGRPGRETSCTRTTTTRAAGLCPGYRRAWRPGPTPSRPTYAGGETGSFTLILSGLGAASGPTPSVPALWFDTESQPFDDPRVRFAISYAIDQELINQIFWDGRGDLQSPVPDALFPQWTTELDDPGRSSGMALVRTWGSRDDSCRTPAMPTASKPGCTFYPVGPSGQRS